jgi:hypothetical protein
MQKKRGKCCYDKIYTFFVKRFRSFFCSIDIERFRMKKDSKNSDFLKCEMCDYSTCKKNEWDRHILTRKHIDRTNIEQTEQKNSTKLIYTCNKCNKNYSARNSLWYHEKKCNIQEQIIQPLTTDMSYNIIFEIVKQNQEFKELLIEQNKENQKLQQQLLEMAKEGKTINNSTTNNNNNFNLQFFLNEQCKDALNIMDFVSTIKLQLSDLDMIGRVGYTEGMSKIFIRNLKELDVFKRPIHCSDLKRETLYVKDKDAWEKENGENIKIKQAIKGIENKNIKQLPKWREENPSAADTETKKHVDYQNILLEAMGGSTLENDDKKHDKIVRNIAKEVVIDKTSDK